MFPEFEAKFSAERNRQKWYHSTNSYSLERYGIKESDLYERLEFILKRFEFSSEDISEGESKEML